MGVRYGGAVSVRTSAGDIMLARVERVISNGFSRIRYTGITESELPTADRMSWSRITSSTTEGFRPWCFAR